MLKINFSVIFNNVIADDESEVEVCSLGHFCVLLYKVNTINRGVFVWLGNALQKYVNEVGIGVIKYSLYLDFKYAMQSHLHLDS